MQVDLGEAIKDLPEQVVILQPFEAVREQEFFKEDVPCVRREI